MKIVIFIDWFAPAYKAGGPIQSIVNLVNQPMEGVAYKIICSNKDLDGQPLTGVQFDTWTRFNPQTEVWYNTKNKELFSLLKSLSSWKPDLYFVNGIYSFYYNLLPLFFGKAERKIISARGMLHTGALSQKSPKKKIYLRIWKLLNIHRSHSFHATNQEEKQFIQLAFGNNTKVFIAQNLPRVLNTLQLNAKEKNILQLISIGLVSPMKNYLNVLNALGTCKEKIHYNIYGPIKDENYWLQCQAKIKLLPANITVEYQGDLSSDKVPEKLNESHVFVLPSKSENFGHAIYEALTTGLPVITSHNTPWNGLEEFRAGFNVSLENDYELSKAICFFAAASEAELGIWSAGAKAYSEKAIDLVQIKMQYRNMFQL